MCFDSVCCPRTDLYSLVLATTANNKLTDSAPSELGNLGNLEEFDLSYNSVTGQIPIEYRTLPALTNLNLKATFIYGNLDPIFCTRNELPLVAVLESLEADCLIPELTCNCCTVCCENGGSDTDKSCVEQNNE